MGIFFEIPGHNQLDVLRKLEFKDFINFKQCSQETVEISRNFRHQLPLFIKKFVLQDHVFKMRIDKNSEERGIERILEEPLRLEVLEFRLFGRITKEQFVYLEEIRQKTKMAVEKYNIYEGDSAERNDLSMIDNLIILLNPVVVVASSSFTLEKLKELGRVKRVEATYMESAHFLKIKTPEISFPHAVHAHHLNEYFKQWLEGKREIEYLNLCIKSHGRPRAFSDLEFSVLWSWETPELGSFTHLKTLLDERKMDYIYSLKRNDGKNIFVLMIYYSEAMEVVVRNYEDIKEIEERIVNRIFQATSRTERWFGIFPR